MNQLMDQQQQTTHLQVRQHKNKKLVQVSVLWTPKTRFVTLKERLMPGTTRSEIIITPFRQQLAHSQSHFHAIPSTCDPETSPESTTASTGATVACRMVQTTSSVCMLSAHLFHLLSITMLNTSTAGHAVTMTSAVDSVSQQMVSMQTAYRPSEQLAQRQVVGNFLSLT